MSAGVSRRTKLGDRRIWRDRLDERASLRALSIAQRHGLPELLARIVAGRGIEVEDVPSFLDPTLKRLMPDPNVLSDMVVAAQRIADAVTRGECVAIFGDYDVDGATSTALLARFLRRAGSIADPYPGSHLRGLWPNVERSASLAERGATLLITVDCAPQHGAACQGAAARTRNHRHRPPPRRRMPAAGAGGGQPEPARHLSGLGHLAAVG